MQTGRLWACTNELRLPSHLQKTLPRAAALSMFSLGAAQTTHPFGHEQPCSFTSSFGRRHRPGREIRDRATTATLRSRRSNGLLSSDQNPAPRTLRIDLVPNKELRKTRDHALKVVLVCRSEEPEVAPCVRARGRAAPWRVHPWENGDSVLVGAGKGTIDVRLHGIDARSVTRSARSLALPRRLTSRPSWRWGRMVPAVVNYASRRAPPILVTTLYG